MNNYKYKYKKFLFKLKKLNAGAESEFDSKWFFWKKTPNNSILLINKKFSNIHITCFQNNDLHATFNNIINLRYNNYNTGQITIRYGTINNETNITEIKLKYNNWHTINDNFFQENTNFDNESKKTISDYINVHLTIVKNAYENFIQNKILNYSALNNFIEQPLSDEETQYKENLIIQFESEHEKYTKNRKRERE